MHRGRTILSLGDNSNDETRDILMAMASCFKDNDSDVSDKIPKLVDQIYDDGPEKTQAMTVVTLMMSGMQSGEH